MKNIPLDSTVKIFGIGFHKTATKSLGQALQLLEFSVCGPVGVRNPNIRERVWDIVEPMLEQYDAFQDNPWPLLYRDLDKRYPASKFILTLRPENEWLNSVLAHFGDECTPMRKWIYGMGSPRGNELVYLERYRQHNAEVLDYFRDRPDDLLVLRITEGDGWEKLSPFLSLPSPDVTFPFLNTKLNRID